uniref:Protein kinase domain-containing protein n=1 Tax=Oryzias melastigma TaxID=30732 RepID=A0A3B3C187_ORYME
SILYPRTCEFHYAQCEKPVSLENIENTEGLQTDRDQEKMSSKIEEEDKSFVVKTGQSLEGHLGTYEVGELLGKGSYGRVFKCYKVGSEEIVAIKILENVKEGREEFKAMKLIKDLDPDQNNLMKFHECFSYNNATCLVYEILYVSLQMCLSKTHFHLFQIRAFAQQMFQALSALKSIGVVHGDIKLDNILLVKSKSLRIKLIDFGFAKKANKLLKGTEIQITPFRAPEVILGLPLDESIDMWAVGSVLACLYNRGYLFPCDTEYETIRAMVLPTADEYTQNTRKQVKDHVVDLDAIIQVHQDRFDDHDDDDHRVFIDLLKRMLEVNPQNRITPSQALAHDFITMKHLSGEAVLKPKTLSLRILSPWTRVQGPSWPRLTTTGSGCTGAVDLDQGSQTRARGPSAARRMMICGPRLHMKDYC